MVVIIRLVLILRFIKKGTQPLEVTPQSGDAGQASSASTTLPAGSTSSPTTEVPQGPTVASCTCAAPASSTAAAPDMHPETEPDGSRGSRAPSGRGRARSSSKSRGLRVLLTRPHRHRRGRSPRMGLPAMRRTSRSVSFATYALFLPDPGLLCDELPEIASRPEMAADW